MTDIENLSELELKVLMEQVDKALKDKQANKHKEVIAKIKELAASINVKIEIIETDNKRHEPKLARAAVKLPAKFRHPENPELTWTGRGIAPKWLQALLSEGHTKADFKI